MNRRTYAAMLLIFIFTALQASNDGRKTDVIGSAVFEASFSDGFCGFKQADGETTVWTHESDGWMKADGYGKTQKKDVPEVFNLVSPVIVLSGTGNAVSFDEMGNYFSDRWADEAQLVIKNAGSDEEWHALERTYIIGDQTSPKNTGSIMIPSRYNGKSVLIGFRYKSDGHHKSGTWRVRNLRVTVAESKKEDAKIAFSTDKTEYVFGSDIPFKSPELINPNGLDVAFSSSNVKVAAADSKTGDITIKAEGTAVITASWKETDIYEGGSTSYTLRVVSAEDAVYAEPATRSPMVAIEFTGQTCRYCPNQMRGLAENQVVYGKENFIIAALHHLESFSKLPASQVSLFNAEAGAYAESLEVHEGLPQLAYNSLGPWRTDLTLEEMYKTEDLMECKGKVTLEGSKFNIRIKTRVRMMSNNKPAEIDGNNTDIILWVLENGIKAYQSDNGTPTYPLHNHIFRGSLNTTWGEPYTPGTEYSRVIKVPETVAEAKNTEILALIVEHDTRKILDAVCIATDAEATGIKNVEDARAYPVYNLQGMRVNDTKKGEIYIRNGKKFVAE